MAPHSASQRRFWTIVLTAIVTVVGVALAIERLFEKVIQPVRSQL